MDKSKLIPKLQSQSTWQLFFLSLLTLGVYEAFYFRRQTRVINEYLDQGDRIPSPFVTGFMVVTWISVAIFFPNLLVEKDHPIERVSTFVDVLWMILATIWAFKLRNRINTLLGSSKGDTYWFKGLWTFIFTAFYINFKINKMEESLPNQGVQGTPAGTAPVTSNVGLPINGGSIRQCI